MSLKQLNTLYKFEHDKEQVASRQLQQAQLEYQQHLQRRQSVADYRLEYMKRLNERSLVGIDSATYAHYHAFIAKLDYANQQVELAIQQAEAMLEKRKKAWLIQRQKLQSVDLLKDKELYRMQVKADRLEQKMFDEFAMQQFVRRAN